MAINQLIAAGIQPPRFESPYNMMAQFAQIQQAQQANALNQMRMQQMERQMAQEEALGGMDYATLSQNPEAALRFGAPGRALYGEMLKGQRERRQAEQAQRDAELKSLGTLRFALADVSDQPSYDRWRGLVGQLAPSLKDAVKPEYDPEVVKRYQVEADKRLEAFSPKPTQMRLGDRVVTIDTNPNSPTYNKEISTRAMGVEPKSPEELARIGAETQRALAAADVSRAELAGTLPARPGVQTELTRLIAERDKLPPNDPNRAAYDARIEALGRGSGVTIETPVPVVDPRTGQVTYATRQEALGKTPPQFMEGLTPRERQNREAKLPAAKAAVSAFDAKSDKLAAQIEELLEHPGLNQITGLIGGRIIGVTDAGRRAESLYKSIVAQGGFSELQAMRDASTTGGALGNVSNQEGQYLRDAFAVLQRTQSTEDLKKGLTSALNTLRSAQQRTREAFEDTYAYREGAAPTVAPPSRGSVGAEAPTSAGRQAALPMPARKEDAVAGQVYQTARGPARWDGKQFIPVSE